VFIQTFGGCRWATIHFCVILREWYWPKSIEIQL
jgi:hypothetical protein